MLSSAEAKVDVTNPWGDDALGREKFAKHLTDLVNSVGNVPFCVAVDGGWGSGKTFFLKRWRTEFAKKDKAASEQGNVIYFDAWEDDFHVDPLTAIIGQLWKEIKSPVLKEICDSVTENWETIVGKTVKAACHYYGPGLVPDLTSGDLQTASRKIVGEYLETRHNIDELKNLLKELAGKTKKETKKPLVFVVDELDRCRPTFAIELLERVKHVAGVPGIVFVFGINQKGLEKSIQSVYGKIDANDYLRRFFDVGMTLPQAIVYNYCKYLIDELKIEDAIAKSNYHSRRQSKGWESYWYDFVKKMPIMVNLLGLSLRQIEQAVRMLLVVLRSKEIAAKPRTKQSEDCFGVFILLRIKDRDLYDKFINEDYSVKATMDDMLHFLPKEKVSNYPSSELTICINTIVNAFYLCYGMEEYSDIIHELQAVRNSKELTQKRFMPKIIVEMENKSMQGMLARDLLSWVTHTLNARTRGDGVHRLPIQQRIARFLEWGDNWQS